MKLVLLLVSLAVCVYSQSYSDCGAFTFPNQIPPDHGSFGTCSASIPHGGNCSFTCDSDSLNSWSLQGAPYHCDNGVISGGPQTCKYNNYVPGAQNCVVSSWNSISDTVCSTGCGGGEQSWTRRVLSFGTAGGEPCPTLAISVPCNTGWCSDNILSRGYYHWGPFCADTEARTINYYVYTSENIDLYVFDQPDFDRYTWDAAMVTPQNAYYYPVDAYLTTNFEKDSFTVPAGSCYHLVLDNTAVGPTQGNANTGQYDNIFFFYTIQGGTAYDGFSNFNMQAGTYQPAAAVRSSSVSFFGVFFTAIVLLVLKLE